AGFGDELMVWLGYHHRSARRRDRPRDVGLAPMIHRLLLVAAVGLVLSSSHAGAAEPVHRVGVLWGFAIPEWTAAWLRGLREQGWVVGQNLKVDYRYYFDDVERIPALAAELAALEPDIVVAGGVLSVRAVRSAAPSVPVVFLAVPDPIGDG